MALPGAQEMPLGAALPIETLGADAQIPNLSGISGARLPRAAAEVSAQTPAAAASGAVQARPAPWNDISPEQKIALRDHAAALAQADFQAKAASRRQTILGRIASAVKTAISRKGRAQSAASARLQGERTFDGLGAVSRAADISAEASEAPSKISVTARPSGASAGALKASTPADGAVYAAQSVPPAVHGTAVPAMLAMSVGVGFLHVGAVAGAVVAGMIIGGYIGRRKGLASRTGGGGDWDFGTPLYTLIGGLIGAGVGGIAGAVLVSLHAVSLAALGAGLLHAALPGVGGAVLGAVLGGYLGVKKAKADGGGGGYFNIGPTLYGLIGALAGAAVLGTAAAMLGAHFLGAHAAHAATVAGLLPLGLISRRRLAVNANANQEHSKPGRILNFLEQHMMAIGIAGAAIAGVLLTPAAVSWHLPLILMGAGAGAAVLGVIGMFGAFAYDDPNPSRSMRIIGAVGTFLTRIGFLGLGMIAAGAGMSGAKLIGSAIVHLGAHAAAASAGIAAPRALSATFMGFPPAWTSPSAQAYVPNQGVLLMQAIKAALPALKAYAIAAAAVAGAALAFYGGMLLTELRGLKKDKPGQTGGLSKTSKKV